MKLFRQYLKERENKHLIYTDAGFATYQYGPDYVYLEDVFVVPEMRRTGFCSKLVKIVCERAIEKEIKILRTTVDLKANNPELGLKAALGLGFKPYSCNNDIIYFSKEIV